MRSHHCKECGRCVDRLDHHCPWIDNCVGLGNQRSFYIFIMALLLVITSFYYTVFLYFCDEVFPEMAQGSFFGLISELASGAWGPEIRTFSVIGASVFNLVWFAFVGALVARHTAYMAVNVTTYEVLVRPSHVQRRFPKCKGRFWFLQNFGFLECFGRCLSYWTLETERDAGDFLGASPVGDSFVVPGGLDHGGAAGSGSSRGRAEDKAGGAAYHLVGPDPDIAA